MTPPPRREFRSRAAACPGWSSSRRSCFSHTWEKYRCTLAIDKIIYMGQDVVWEGNHSFADDAEHAEQLAVASLNRRRSNSTQCMKCIEYSRWLGPASWPARRCCHSAQRQRCSVCREHVSDTPACIKVATSNCLLRPVCLRHANHDGAHAAEANAVMLNFDVKCCCGVDRPRSFNLEPGNRTRVVEQETAVLLSAPRRSGKLGIWHRAAQIPLRTPGAKPLLLQRIIVDVQCAQIGSIFECLEECWCRRHQSGEHELLSGHAARTCQTLRRNTISFER